VVYTRGLGETVDLYAGAVYVDLRPGAGSDEARGAGNPTFGARWRFLDASASETSAAAKPEFLLPVSGNAEAAALGSANLGGNLTFILCQDRPFGAIHINASAGRLRYRASGNNPDSTPMRLSAAPVWQLNPQWRLALDIGAQWVQSFEQRVRTGSVELGASWSPDDDLDLALSAIRTADYQNPGTSALAATAGLTWRFKKERAASGCRARQVALSGASRRASRCPRQVALITRSSASVSSIWARFCSSSAMAVSVRVIT